MSSFLSTPFGSFFYVTDRDIQSQNVTWYFDVKYTWTIITTAATITAMAVNTSLWRQNMYIYISGLSSYTTILWLMFFPQTKLCAAHSILYTMHKHIHEKTTTNTENIALVYAVRNWIWDHRFTYWTNFHSVLLSLQHGQLALLLLLSWIVKLSYCCRCALDYAIF